MLKRWRNEDGNQNLQSGADPRVSIAGLTCDTDCILLQRLSVRHTHKDTPIHTQAYTLSHSHIHTQTHTLGLIFLGLIFLGLIFLDLFFLGLFFLGLTFLCSWPFLPWPIFPPYPGLFFLSHIFLGHSFRSPAHVKTYPYFFRRTNLSKFRCRKFCPPKNFVPRKFVQ